MSKKINQENEKKVKKKENDVFSLVKLFWLLYICRLS